MRTDKGDSEAYTVAMQLREHIAGLYGAEPPSRIILCPGILISLHLLFANLRVRRVVLTTEEYYNHTHFSNFDVNCLPIDEILQEVQHLNPDAVIISLVTWRGKNLHVKELFRQLRKAMSNPPILIADYSQAGAIGFPRVAELEADIVCGDPMKWIMQPYEDSNLAFLWFRDAYLFDKAKLGFAPFFLATVDWQHQLFARWVDPAAVMKSIDRIGSLRINRSALIRRSQENLSLAVNLASQLDIDQPVESSILYLSERRDMNLLPQWALRPGLIWKMREGGMRILCRADERTSSIG